VGNGKTCGKQVRFARKETDINAKRNQTCTKRKTYIKTRVVYAEQYARSGYTEPAHPDRDPVSVSSIL
jgi:hypothetical protein